jgi:SAM-dependent methyltransferase
VNLPTDKMKDWYKRPHERDRWGESIVKEGLYPTEKALVDEFFTKGGSLLNIGCGGGREAVALAEHFDLTAVDFSAEFCRLCEKTVKDHGLKALVLQMNAMNLAFDDGSFDYIVMVGQLIGHIPGRANRIQALKEACRVLKPEGRAMISTNAIERGWKYRLYFAAANLVRKIYNPHGLEPDDALVFHVDGKRALWGKTENRPVFHWYRTARFLEDIAEAGFTCRKYLRRFQYEDQALFDDSSTSGETFYILEKPA